MSVKRKVENGQDTEGSAATQVKMGRNDLPSTSGGEQNVNCDGQDGGVIADVQDENGRRTEDWLALVATFPEELWILILESIKDPDTLTSLSNASPVFRDWLFPRRVQFLFPKVWDILGVKYHKEARDEDDDDDQKAGSGDEAYQEPILEPDSGDEDEDDDEQLTTWCSGILKLRMVCKIWCDAMDHWYQNQPFRYEMYNEEPFEADSYHRTIRKINSLAEDSFHEGGLESLESFGSHFESTHCVDGVAIRNPFLGRSVSVCIGWQNDGAEQFLDCVKALFLKYGRCIWYLKINVDSKYVARVSGYSIISALLQAVPNLRSLHLTNVSPDGSQDELGEIEMDNHQYDYLESYIGLHPLPKLDHLRFLSTRHFSKLIPSIVFQQLVGLSDQLSILETGYCDYSLEDYNISTATLPNLSELALDIRYEVTFARFFARGDINWRLSKLDLTIFYAFGVGWERLFKELELKWADTLTTLILTLPLVQSVEDRNRLLELGANLRLNLPRMTKLYLTMNNLCSLDFLLPMKESLQVLGLELEESVDPEVEAQCQLLMKRVERGKVIQLLSRPDKPMESNVWTIFPKLKRLQLDYTMSSHSEATKHKDSGGTTKWSVSRGQWENWRKQNHCYRREKMGLWEMRR